MHYKISTWHRFSGVIEGQKISPGDVFEIMTSQHYDCELPYIKELAKDAWLQDRYKDKIKKLQIFEEDQLVYSYDSIIGEKIY